LEWLSTFIPTKPPASRQSSQTIPARRRRSLTRTDGSLHRLASRCSPYGHLIECTQAHQPGCHRWRSQRLGRDSVTQACSASMTPFSRVPSLSLIGLVFTASIIRDEDAAWHRDVAGGASRLAATRITHLAHVPETLERRLMLHSPPHLSQTFTKLEGVAVRRRSTILSKRLISKRPAMQNPEPDISRPRVAIHRSSRRTDHAAAMRAMTPAKRARYQSPRRVRRS